MKMPWEDDIDWGNIATTLGKENGMVTTDKVTVAEFAPHIGKTTTDYKENDMEWYRLGTPDNSSSDFIRREDLIDAIDGTDWYHMHEGKIVYGALDEGDDPLYKIDEIIEAIKNLPRRMGGE